MPAMLCCILLGLVTANFLAALRLVRRHRWIAGGGFALFAAGAAWAGVATGAIHTNILPFLQTPASAAAGHKVFPAGADTYMCYGERQR